MPKNSMGFIHYAPTKVVQPWDAEGILSPGGGVQPSSLKGGSGDLPRESFRFRNAVDAFLLHLEYNFGL